MSQLAAALHRLEVPSGNSFSSQYPTYIEERPLYWQSRLFAQMQFLTELSAQQDGRYDAELLPIVREAAERYRANGYVAREDCLQAEQEALKIGIPAKEYQVLCIGHAHIDMNWTWGFEETVQVVLDTLSTVLALMREYPDFRFSQSQASVYRIVEEYGPPAMLDELRRRVQEGRLEVTASTWVEADKNLPNAESQARQILYTKRYLSRLLSLREEDLCIDFEPDTFGHPLHTPEILAAAGIRYYYFNRGWAGPAISRWQAPSGAQVLSYMDSAFYSAIVDHSLLAGKLADCAASGQKTMLKLYGVGDHGGGPTRRDLDRLRDCMSWPLYPRLRFGTLREFYETLDRDAVGLPVLCGERNPVYTGCYTTQTRIKAAARRTQRMLQQAECSAALDYLAGGEAYDRRALARGWEKLLFQQFHDILPGSCVRESREYALGCLQQAGALANTVRQRALRSLAEKADTACFADAGPANPLLLGAGAGSGAEKGQTSQAVLRAGAGRTVFLWNPSAFARRETVEITVWDWSPRDVGLLAFYDEKGQLVPCQVLTGGFNSYWSHSYVTALVQTEIPAFGYRVLGIRDKDDLPVRGGRLADGCERLARPDVFVLENALVRASFSPRDGRLLSLVRLRDGHEYLDASRGGAGFRFLYEDTDKGMTAWIDGRWMSETAIENVRIRKTADGPLRQAIRMQAAVGNSRLEIEVSLDDGSPALTFAGRADWREYGSPEHGIPQLRFDAALADGSRSYCYDVPMGLIARQEADLDQPACSFAASRPDSEGDALMLWSDSRHGFRGFAGSLGVTLIRSSYNPDPCPEAGETPFVLKLAPADTADPAAMCRQAERYDSPIQAVADTAHPGSLPAAGSLMEVEADGAVVDSVKLAEDGGALILRLHETQGRAGTASVAFRRPVERAVLTDLLEQEPDCRLPAEGERISVPLSPYSLRTVKVVFGG
ncbi:MAG TPA: alpha-mannosidase [Firmicutes bacterium]|nr:alpha-mannosidase [Bacillota bacterium]